MMTRSGIGNKVKGPKNAQASEEYSHPSQRKRIAKKRSNISSNTSLTTDLSIARKMQKEKNDQVKKPWNYNFNSATSLQRNLEIARNSRNKNSNISDVTKEKKSKSFFRNKKSKAAKKECFYNSSKNSLKDSCEISKSSSNEVSKIDSTKSCGSSSSNDLKVTKNVSYSNSKVTLSNDEMSKSENFKTIWKSNFSSNTSFSIFPVLKESKNSFKSLATYSTSSLKKNSEIKTGSSRLSMGYLDPEVSQIFLPTSTEELTRLLGFHIINSNIELTKRRYDMKTSKHDSDFDPDARFTAADVVDVLESEMNQWGLHDKKEILYSQISKRSGKSSSMDINELSTKFLSCDPSEKSEKQTNKLVEDYKTEKVIRCPDNLCKFRCFISAFTKHLCDRHFNHPIICIRPGDVKEFLIYPDSLNCGIIRCHMCYLVSGVVKNYGEDKLKSYLPLLVLGTRFKLKPTFETEGNITEYVELLFSALLPTDFRLYIQVKAVPFANSYVNTKGIPTLEFKYEGIVHSLQQTEKNNRKSRIVLAATDYENLIDPKERCLKFEIIVREVLPKI